MNSKSWKFNVLSDITLSATLNGNDKTQHYNKIIACYRYMSVCSTKHVNKGTHQLPWVYIIENLINLVNKLII